MYVINGRIFVFSDRTDVIENGFVGIRDGKIESVGSMEDFKSLVLDRKEKLLDVSGAWVMPGLIDAHCHVGVSEEKWGSICDDCNETTDPVTPYLRALDAVNPMDSAFHDAIMAGITSLMTGPGSSNVVGGQSVFLKTQGRTVDSMVVRAPAAMKVAFGENPKANYGDKGRMPFSRMGTAAMLREELYGAVRYYEKKKRQELSAPDFRKECWIPVLEKKIPLKAHVHRADDILTAIRIAKEFGLCMTLDHCTEGHFIADEIKASGFPVIVGPLLTSRSKIEVKYLSPKTAGVLHRAGVKVAVMTDHPVSLVQYLPIYAGQCVKYGLPMTEGLKAVTRNAAQICGVFDRVGSIETGKDADIAIFTGNPMETFTKTLYTIIDGRIVYSMDDSG